MAQLLHAGADGPETVARIRHILSSLRYRFHGPRASEKARPHSRRRGWGPITAGTNALCALFQSNRLRKKSVLQEVCRSAMRDSPSSSKKSIAHVGCHADF